MDSESAEASVKADKKQYLILPTDTLEFVPEALIITRANGQRIVLPIEYMPSIRMPDLSERLPAQKY
jgi:hypothetical protein